MASRKCSLKGCNNTLAANSPHDYCHLHRDLAANSVAMDETSLRESAPELFTLKGISYSSVEQFSNALVDGTPIHGSYSAEVAKACGNWNKMLSGDGTVPAFGSQLDAPEALNRFRQELLKQGISPERITEWEFSHGSRRDPFTGTKQSFGAETHRALVLDKGTTREVVIDPSVSKYAPVYDRNSPVDEELPSGMTPFGESPWIGSMDEYVDGGFLSWGSYSEVSNLN